MPRPEEHLSPDRPLADGEAERIAERMAAFATASRLKLLYALAGRARASTSSPRAAGLGQHRLPAAARPAAPAAGDGPARRPADALPAPRPPPRRPAGRDPAPARARRAGLATSATPARRRMSEHARTRHGHSHGLVDLSIKRSRAGVRAVALSLLVLLVDGGRADRRLRRHRQRRAARRPHPQRRRRADRLPLGVAFLLRSVAGGAGRGLLRRRGDLLQRLRRGLPGLDRLINPEDIDHLLALALAGRSASSATRSRRRSACAPDGGWRARRSSPTATTRARTGSSASRWSRARSSLRSACRPPTRSSAS